ncbi:MAG: hypothetical protein CM15mV8_1580 [Caudoviricetes sp.]|nr:MAG: hypothetical protein CM15mV8_1580 [Caudoviricetes sp.]
MNVNKEYMQVHYPSDHTESVKIAKRLINMTTIENNMCSLCE